MLVNIDAKFTLQTKFVGDKFEIRPFSNCYQRLKRCWWRMLKMNFVRENFKIFVTILADIVAKILYL